MFGGVRAYWVFVCVRAHELVCACTNLIHVSVKRQTKPQNLLILSGVTNLTLPPHLEWKVEGARGVEGRGQRAVGERGGGLGGVGEEGGNLFHCTVITPAALPAGDASKPLGLSAARVPGQTRASCMPLVC